jgi:hypothetical protein
MVNLKKIKKKELVQLNLKMGHHIMENLKMIKLVVMVLFIILMVVIMKLNLMMELFMVMENLLG